MATAGEKPHHQEIGESLEEKVLAFLREFRDAEHASAPSEDAAAAALPYYARAIADMRSREAATLTLLYEHLCDWNALVAESVGEHYLMVEPFLRRAVAAFVQEHDPAYCVDDHGRPREFYVSVVGLPKIERLRDLRTEKVGRLASFKGTVTRTSEVRPELFLGAFRCVVEGGFC